MVSISLLIVISLVTSLQQIPAISQNRRTYDEQYIVALRYIADLVPKNETLAATASYPQVSYFTDHQAKTPWLSSERALVQFMLNNNISYLVVPVDELRGPEPDKTPLLVQLAKKPFEEMADFYAKYISVPKPLLPLSESNTTNNPLLNNPSSGLEQDNNNNNNNNNNTRMDMRKTMRGDLFAKLFERIFEYPTEDSILHLYHLRSNITLENLRTVTDKTKPLVSISLPVNGTVMESPLGVLRLNVTGTAADSDSNIEKVEVSIDGSRYRLANPKMPDDWSTWSYSDIITYGTKRIMVRATDSADNMSLAPVSVTVR
jgi:hypothetical protein